MPQPFWAFLAALLADKGCFGMLFILCHTASAGVLGIAA
jgi:hypothetical protein